MTCPSEVQMKQLVIALAFLLMPVCGFSATPDLLLKLQKTYSGINSFDADFTQTLTHKESGSKEKRNGKLQFQKPLSIRWQTAKPQEETLVINEREIWDYLPDEQIAYRYSPAVAQDSRSIIQVLTGQARLDKDFNVKLAGMENGLQKLALFPKDPTPQMVEAAIWVEPSSGIIRRASVIDFYGNVNDVSFSNFKENAKISPKQFSFQPPKGVEIEDRIEKGLEERQLFK